MGMKLLLFPFCLSPSPRFCLFCLNIQQSFTWPKGTIAFCLHNRIQELVFYHNHYQHSEYTLLGPYIGISIQTKEGNCIIMYGLYLIIFPFHPSIYPYFQKQWSIHSFIHPDIMRLRYYTIIQIRNKGNIYILFDICWIQLTNLFHPKFTR